MRGFEIPAASRAPVVLALAIAGFGTTAHAAAQKSPASIKHPFLYNTSAAIRATPRTVGGPAALEFQGVTGATLNPRSSEPIQLGQFVVSPAAGSNGRTTTYDHTPFVIQIRAPELDKSSTVPLLHQILPRFGRQLGTKTVTESSLLIRGELNGTVSPTGESNVTAMIKSLRPGGIGAGTSDHVTRYAFPVRFGDLKLPPESSLTPKPPLPAAAAEQVLLPAPAPEPSTIVLFAAALGGLVLGRRRLDTARR